ncbi:hypothetical protein O181_035461 [Austropuccinia psidii MF-1]|uniref:Uncharacterized protein n=1 Tax=Austropuccinia psidii MF-1 TaxID=1389203 RepID=A0A9Q3H8Z4_9BASI|nr:hypothetical protein [Austropuccinia psidii MF-1]
MLTVSFDRFKAKNLNNPSKFNQNLKSKYQINSKETLICLPPTTEEFLTFWGLDFNFSSPDLASHPNDDHWFGSLQVIKDQRFGMMTAQPDHFDSINSSYWSIDDMTNSWNSPNLTTKLSLIQPFSNDLNTINHKNKINHSFAPNHHLINQNHHHTILSTPLSSNLTSACSTPSLTSNSPTDSPKPRIKSSTVHFLDQPSPLEDDLIDSLILKLLIHQDKFKVFSAIEHFLEIPFDWIPLKQQTPNLNQMKFERQLDKKLLNLKNRQSNTHHRGLSFETSEWGLNWRKNDDIQTSLEDYADRLEPRQLCKSRSDWSLYSILDQQPELKYQSNLTFDQNDDDDEDVLDEELKENIDDDGMEASWLMFGQKLVHIVKWFY